MTLIPKAFWLALAVAVSVLLPSARVAAQDFTFGWDPRSGDAWVDRQLEDINRYGARYREPFVDEIVRYYGAPRELVTDLLVTRGWAPGDVYYACSIAQALGRPCRYVVDQWDRDHQRGWGAVAGELGIKPGSAEFHRLKRGFVTTYDRWSRPIEIDPELHPDFPTRGNGNAAAKGKDAQGDTRQVDGKPGKQDKRNEKADKVEKDRKG